MAFAPSYPRLEVQSSKPANYTIPDVEILSYGILVFVSPSPAL
jgi:hypothetical protein